MEKNLGHATAYGYAKSKGYSGTEEEFAQLMADYASVGQSAAQSAEQAAASATSASASAQTASQAAQTATSKASEAVTAASTATTKASEANQSASTASAAAASASTSAQTATTAAATATTKASEAAESATTATTAKTDAETARDAAAQSASAAAASAASIDPDEFDRKIYAAFATDTATGAIASFADGADDIPMKDVLVHIEPVQEGSGDPSPDNVRPITGWTGAKVTRAGKNMLPYPFRETRTQIGGLSFADNGDGTITVDGTATGNVYYNLFSSSDVIRLKAGTYKIPSTANNAIQFNWYYRDTTAISLGSQERVFTLANDTDVYCFLRIASGTTLQNTTLKPMLCLASDTDSTYEPYSGQTYDITFPTEAGTVYGGTLDVTSGVLTVDRAMVDLGTLTWTLQTDGQNPVFRNDSIKDFAKISNNFVFSMHTSYPDASITTMKNEAPNNSGTVTTSGIICIRDDSYADAATFKSAMSGAQLVYELATPITYQLTPQEITSLLGTNNLWTDAGNSEVEYRADTKMYITKKITEAVSALS